jgi:hypothetical protein
VKSVAIIGTRNPDTQQLLMAERLARVLSQDYGVTIATGGAYGIDQAAMRGSTDAQLAVYLPWRSYNQEIVPANAGRIVVADPVVHRTWFESVDRYHPNPRALTRGARALHARNFGIVADRNLVVAFPDEQGAGGTGQGIRIADGESIPVLQFNRNASMPSFEDILRQAVNILGWF